MEGTWTVTKLNGAVVGGEADADGLDYGNGNKPIKVVAYRTNTLVVKIPGGSHWVANHAPWKSHGGQYLLLDILAVKDDSETYLRVRARDILDFPLR